MAAEVGAAHQRAREFLARAAGDATYGRLVDEGFDAGAFADEIIQRDKQRSLDDTSPSAAVGAVDAIKAYKVQLQTHIEDHVEESREALLRSSRGLQALRGDVEAVALAARDAKRKTRAMTRKLTKPYDSCERKTRRLRLVFEANEILRRAQRCRFALRRLEEKRGLSGPEDLAARAALVNEIETLVDPPARDGQNAASLDVIDVCRGARDAALQAREELEGSADVALDEALTTLNMSRAGAALAVAAELGRLEEAVDRALKRLADAAQTCTAAALAGRDPREDADAEPLTAPFAKDAAQAHARHWAAALRSSSQRAALLETALRKRRVDVAAGAETLHDAAVKAGAFKGKTSLRARHASEAAEAVRGALVEALRKDEEVPVEEEQDESSSDEEDAKPEAEATEDTLLGRTKSIINKATERTTDLIDKTQEHLDRLDERTEALAAAATKALKKTGSTIKDSVVGLSAKRAADAVAGALADHYPVVRRAFLAAAAEPFAAITDHDESQAAHQRLFDEYPSLTIDPLNDEGMLPLALLPPDGDYLGGAATAAPPKSFVALFEAQFAVVADHHAASAFGVEDTGVDAAMTDALAAAASLEPGPVDDVTVGNRLEMGLTRTHCRASVGRTYGPSPEFAESWETENAAQALCGRDFEPGAVSRAKRAARGPNREPLNVELPTDAAVEAVSSVESLGEALGPLEAQYLAQCRARLLGPVHFIYPEQAGYDAAVPTHTDVDKLLAIGRDELRRVDDSALEDAVCREIAGACTDFAERATRALRNVPAGRDAKAFGKLSRAVTEAYASTAPTEALTVPRAEWRASVREEFDARTAGACAVLRKGVATLRTTDALLPGLDALDAVCERVAFRGVDAAAYACCAHLANADVEEDYSEARDASKGAPLGASPCVVRLLSSLNAIRAGYLAFLPAWPKLQPNQDSPAARAAVPALAARVARQTCAHVCLRRPLAGGGRLVVARDIDALCDALADYAPETGVTLPRKRPGAQLLADEATAAAELKDALDELRALKRLLFVEPRLAEGETRAGAVLRAGLELAPVLRPSCAWHHCLAACGHARLPLPDALDVGEDVEASPALRAAYVAQLCDGDYGGDSLDTRRAREQRAWLDVLRCLGAWATRASATGVSALGDVHEAVQRDGAALRIASSPG